MLWTGMGQRSLVPFQGHRLQWGKGLQYPSSARKGEHLGTPDEELHVTGATPRHTYVRVHTSTPTHQRPKFRRPCLLDQPSVGATTACVESLLRGGPWAAWSCREEAQMPAGPGFESCSLSSSSVTGQAACISDPVLLGL